MANVISDTDSGEEEFLGFNTDDITFTTTSVDDESDISEDIENNSEASSSESSEDEVENNDSS
jgi:hypothetical protein